MPEIEQPTIYVVDDDANVGMALSRLIRTAGFGVETYSSVDDFLDRYHARGTGCIILDVALGEWNGLDVQRRLAVKGYVHPIVFISGQSELQTSVQAMKAGAVDFLTKPVNADELFQAIYSALNRDRLAQKEFRDRTNVNQLLKRLTPREYEVLLLVLRGKFNKQIAYELGIVEKTAKVHRARVMTKMRARNVAELVRMCNSVVPGLDQSGT